MVRPSALLVGSSVTNPDSGAKVILVGDEISLGRPPRCDPTLPELLLRKIPPKSTSVSFDRLMRLLNIVQFDSKRRCVTFAASTGKKLMVNKPVEYNTAASAKLTLNRCPPQSWSVTSPILNVFRGFILLTVSWLKRRMVMDPKAKRFPSWLSE